MAPNITIQDWRKGSQWFEINRDLALAIVVEQKYYSLFKEYCHPPCYNDEHYLPTLVNMLYGKVNSNLTVTYVDWSIPAPHPRRFVGNEITEELLNTIRFGSTECVYNGNMTPVDSKNLFDRVSSCTSLFSLPERLKADNTIRVNQLVTILLINSSIHLLDQNRYLVSTSLIHIESCKSPTAVMFDDDTGRNSIRHCGTKEYHSECSGKISRIMRILTLITTCELIGVQQVYFNVLS
ncbi:putative glycosyl transferase 14 [Tanacetum coccineum]|uniref:Glycosyl transferase 14 n=1 Tax=Tanacetum coccineum TaxID=301880 RepID=A0ABQ5J1R1_9ASTR